MRPTTRHPRRAEQGFTLIELCIVLIIISALSLLLFTAMTSAKVASRNEAMKAAAASVDQALGAFNRIYPRVGASDPFVQRDSGAAWTGNTGSPTTGMADETGAWILQKWPDNPYAPGGVTVRRYATAAPCAAMGVPGEVRACRTALGGMTYQVRAYGRSKDGSTIEVYRATHGAR